MVDDAEVDDAVAHGPVAVLGFGETDGLAGQGLVDVDPGAAPLDLAVVAY